VESFVAQAAMLKLAPKAQHPLAGSIGPQTSETMKKSGLQVDFAAKEPGLEALVAATVKKLASR
jgi:uroporphyrinogen-III synthase